MVGVDQAHQGWKIEDENKSQKGMKRNPITCNVMGHTIGRLQNMRNDPIIKGLTKLSKINHNGSHIDQSRKDILDGLLTHFRASSPNIISLIPTFFAF